MGVILQVSTSRMSSVGWTLQSGTRFARDALGPLLMFWASGVGSPAGRRAVGGAVVLWYAAA